ncbi:iron siderophore ABC transporter substrate-binding protein, partial [Rothia dentocariosa]
VEGSKWTSTGGPLLMNGIVADVRSKLLENQNNNQGQ